MNWLTNSCLEIFLTEVSLGPMMFKYIYLELIIKSTKYMKKICGLSVLSSERYHQNHRVFLAATGMNKSMYIYTNFRAPFFPLHKGVWFFF